MGGNEMREYEGMKINFFWHSCFNNPNRKGFILGLGLQKRGVFFF